MSEPFLGEIRLVPWYYAAEGWASCDGATLPISTNSALFSLLGTRFGGDGKTTFKLPDLRSRIPIGPTPQLPIGSTLGEERHRLTPAEVPSHTHPLFASATAGVKATLEANTSLGAFANGYANAAVGAQPVTTLAPTGIGSVGTAEPHENRQPFLCVNFVIATNGIYPASE